LGVAADAKLELATVLSFLPLMIHVRLTAAYKHLILRSGIAHIAPVYLLMLSMSKLIDDLEPQ
jgi:hypothetical protein